MVDTLYLPCIGLSAAFGRETVRRKILPLIVPILQQYHQPSPVGMINVIKKRENV